MNRCKCLNITSDDLDRNPDLALRVGTMCDVCPMSTTAMIDSDETVTMAQFEQLLKRQEPSSAAPKPTTKKIDTKPSVVYDRAPEPEPTPQARSRSKKFENTETVKVWIVMNDGTSFFARLYVMEGQRVQDLLNDTRMFLPVEKHTSRGRGNEDVWVFTAINKSSIASIEERLDLRK